jgi:hypothetical protein
MPDEPGVWRRRYRLDDVLLVVGTVVVIVGSLLPWVSGATRLIGTIHWTGLDDTGEGLMLIALAIPILAYVRWRERLEEIEPQARWLPLGIAVVSALLWTIALRKAFYVWFPESVAGAHPEIGLLVTAVGIAAWLAGGWLASRGGSGGSARR